MKKYMFLIASCIVMQAAAYAQKGACTLAGQLKADDIVTPVHVKNEEGADFTIPVAADGSFKGNITIPAKGFYTVTAIGNVYLEPGYDLQIRYADSAYQFAGKGALENNAFITAYRSLHHYVPVSAVTTLGQEALYFPVPEFLGKLEAFVAGGKQAFAKSTSAFFREYAGKDLEFYARYLQYLYYLYYGIDLVKQEELHKFYMNATTFDSAYYKKYHELDSAQRVKRLTAAEKEQLNVKSELEWNKNDAMLYRQSPWCRYMYSRYISSLRRTKYSDIWFNPDLDDDQRELVGLKVVQQEVSEPFILAHLRHEKVVNALKLLTSRSIRDSIYRDYVTTVKNVNYRKEAEQIYTNATTFTDNGMAPDFIYEDVNGKMVSLRDLRGKHVYIDVWATWCAPCKAEIPYLEKVEQAFHGKDITFVSLSVDKKADKDKWAAFVKKGSLRSLQLLADKAFESDFIQKFNINAIPRFIIIAPDGRIVSANAARPSDPKLVEMLQELISK